MKLNFGMVYVDVLNVYGTHVFKYNTKWLVNWVFDFNYRNKLDWLQMGDLFCGRREIQSHNRSHCECDSVDIYWRWNRISPINGLENGTIAKEKVMNASSQNNSQTSNCQTVKYTQKLDSNPILWLNDWQQFGILCSSWRLCCFSAHWRVFCSFSLGCGCGCGFSGHHISKLIYFLNFSFATFHSHPRAKSGWERYQTIDRELTGTAVKWMRFNFILMINQHSKVGCLWLSSCLVLFVFAQLFSYGRV